MKLDDLTLGELEWVERKSGKSIMEFGDKPSITVMRYLAVVIKRREDPTYSEQQAADLTMKEMNELLRGENLGSLLDPTEPSPESKQTG